MSTGLEMQFPVLTADPDPGCQNKDSRLAIKCLQDYYDGPDPNVECKT